MTKLKLGIIGTGGICNNKHLPSLAKVADKVEVVALCDQDEEKAIATRERHGLTNAKIYTDYKELLADPEIDVVHVCTPNVAHCQITVDAFEAGKHVLCEKPMAATAADAQRMLDAWKKSSRKFTVGYQNRFRPDVQVLKKACDAGELGEIYYGEANAIRRKAVPTWGVFPNKSLQGGGPLIDIGTHALDITLWCMNNYDVDSISGQVFYKLGHLPEAAEIKHGGSYASSELSFNYVHHGKMVHEDMDGEALVDYFEGVNEAPGVVEARQWVDAILNDTEPCVKPEEAFRVTQILEAIYKASETNSTIKFD